MLQAGDKVYVESSAQIDIGFMAWSFVKAHPLAVVKQRMEVAAIGNAASVCPEGEVVYALEWEEEFQGGHNCQGTTKDRSGQFVAAKHLSLCFEASREANTIPQLKGFEDYLTK